MEIHNHNANFSIILPVNKRLTLRSYNLFEWTDFKKKIEPWLPQTESNYLLQSFSKALHVQFMNHLVPVQKENETRNLQEEQLRSIPVLTRLTKYLALIESNLPEGVI